MSDAVDVIFAGGFLALVGWSALRVPLSRRFSRKETMRGPVDPTQPDRDELL